MKINPIKFYRGLYDRIGTLTPIRADCGALCSKACCAVTDEITGMYLFPHENALYSPSVTWGKIYDTDFTYGNGVPVDLFTCDGWCDRKMRPLACRIFPLVPYAHRGEKLRIIMDPRGRGLCPLASVIKEDELDSEFVKAVTDTMEICMCINQTREFIYALTKELDETL